MHVCLRVHVCRGGHVCLRVHVCRGEHVYLQHTSYDDVNEVMQYKEIRSTIFTQPQCHRV